MTAPIRRTARLTLSPYCVAAPSPRSRHATLINAETGAEHLVTRRLLMALLASGEAELEKMLPPAVRIKGPLRSRLQRSGLLVTERRAEELADATRYPLRSIELAFHRQLNGGGYDPEALDRAHPPAMRKTVRGASQPLPLARDFGQPLSIADCLARRSSKRRFADRPIAIAQLAALLQLACRARAIKDTEIGPSSDRPYPSGGGRYSLEVYPIVYRVAGLEPGAYHYDPFSHALTAVPTRYGFPDALREHAERGMGGRRGAPPSALLVITSVFARTAWKYRRLPYHLVLSDLGALYQTLYLAAEQVRLGVCALGTTAEAWTTEQLGLDGVTEAQVGTIALGEPEPDTVQVDDIEAIHDSPLRGHDGDLVVRMSLVSSGALTVLLSDLALEPGWPERVIATLAGRTTRFEFRTHAGHRLLEIIEGAAHPAARAATVRSYATPPPSPALDTLGVRREGQPSTAVHGSSLHRRPVSPGRSVRTKIG